MLDVEVIGSSLLPEEALCRLVAIALASAGIEEGHLAVEFVRFGGADVVRHRLVQRIVEAYDEHAERAAPELRPAQPDRRRA